MSYIDKHEANVREQIAAGNMDYLRVELAEARKEIAFRDDA
jgi:hypothetical protein